ncbi:MAG: hypothetical protein VX426_00030 [Chloroflexota bacterium]|nr:hypothetical protein [Chloroflexota bacterium]
MTVQKSNIHLVGSIPLENPEEVFRTVSAKFGDNIRRIPDGETGERHRWIYWQRTMLESHQSVCVDEDVEPFSLYQWDGKLLRTSQLLRFKSGVDPNAVIFETGYDKAAISSYQVFCRLKQQGVIPPETLFQVTLPTPIAIGFMYWSPNSREQFLKIYEKSLLKALYAILDAIPHDSLCIQWDVCQEVLIFENYFPDRSPNYKYQIKTELSRLGDEVPKSVELGYHLCYGSPADEHLIMPKDTGTLVDIMNSIRSGLHRRLDYVHFPVPKNRGDDAYFRPLTNLDPDPDTEIFVGLIHYDDPEGDRSRMATARKFLNTFGVATECGWGRTDPKRVSGLLDSHLRAVTSNI